MAWLRQRGRSKHTILDLDYRPALWPDLQTSRNMSRQAIDLSTVVIGNLDECEMALETRDPETAANALLSAGVELAVIKLGGAGVYLASAGKRWTIPPIPVDVVSGLGAGDAFGGALSHGLLSGWEPDEIGRFANAAGALVASRMACAEAMPTLAELDSFITTKEEES
jgi:5-dehydro-2-deoxygluconokinase